MIGAKDRKHVIASSFILIYCLFSFKFQLIKSVGSGIRLDDILIGSLGFIYILYTFRILQVRWHPSVKYMLVFIVWNIISSIYNSYIGRVDLVTSLLFSLRHLEYLFLVIVGYVLGVHSKKMNTFFIWYLFYAVVLVMLQSWGVVGTISGFGTNRGFVANTGGPWEFAAVSAFFVIFFYSRSYVHCSRFMRIKLGSIGGSLSINALLSLAAFVLLVGTQSRITSVSVVLLGLITVSYLQFKKNIIHVLLFYFIVSLVTGALFILNLDIEVIHRITLLFSEESFKALESLYNTMPVVETQGEYFDATYGSRVSEVATLGGDTSSMVRFSRWIVLIRSVVSDEEALWIGFGPSFAFLAVDGNYVRIFAETGIIGLFLFGLFLYSVVKSSRDNNIILSYTFVLIITAFFIDIFTTYKAMLLFWVYLGWCWGQRNYVRSVAA